MHRFRIRFKLPDGETVNIPLESTEIETGSGGSPYLLKSSQGSKPISESSELILSSSGFETEEEAWSAGRSAKAALFVSAAKSGLGIDLGRDTSTGAFGKVVIDMMREEHGVNLRSDVHGLAVYDDQAQTVFGSVSGRVSVGRSGDVFLASLRDGIAQGLSLTEKQRLALELCGYSHFESSLRARFLTLTIAVEALVEMKPRPPRALAHVETLVAMTRAAALEENEGLSMIGSLERLKLNSIGQATRALVVAQAGDKLYGGKRPDQFFADCYAVRNLVVHTGDTPEDLQSLYPELERLVRDLVTSSAVRNGAA